MPKVPKGTCDSCEDQMARRRRALSVMTDLFDKDGVVEIDTTALELRETLTSKYGEDYKLIYDLAHQEGKPVWRPRKKRPSHRYDPAVWETCMEESRR